MANGPVTICVLTYGRHHDLLGRFLRTLYQNTNRSLFRLRIGMNEPGDETIGLVEDWLRREPDILVHHSSINLYKNPMMRRLFTDPPLDSRWTIWFDDDTYITHADWLPRLMFKIGVQPEVAVWGKLYGIFPNKEVCQFIESASWFRGRAWDLQGSENSDAHITFPEGGFWAARTDVLQAIDWPDHRLLLAGEDFVFGEALRQNGHKLGRFDHGVAISHAPRRNSGDLAVRRIPCQP